MARLLASVSSWVIFFPRLAIFVDDENQRMEPGAPSRVLVGLRVDATPERAFAAFTGEIGRWWRPNGLFQFSVGRTGELAFEPGPSGRLVEVATGARP